MPNLRVAYLQHGLAYGGAPVSLYLLQKSLEKRPFDKYLLTNSLGSEEVRGLFLKHNKGIFLVRLTVIHNNQVSGLPVWLFLVKRVFCGTACAQILNQHQIDILHVNTSVFPHLYSRIKQRTAVRIVTHVRELIPRYGCGVVQRYMLDQIRRYSDAIIAISDNEAAPFQGHPKLHVLPNPFDFGSIQPNRGNQFRPTHGISENQVVVLMLGQFHRFKGHLDFLETLRHVLARRSVRSPVVFVIVGVSKNPRRWKHVAKRVLMREDYHRAVSDYIQGHNLDEHVRLIPATTKVFGALEAADIVVRPSLSGDPWGRDVIEAMAFKKPVVATGSSEFFVQNGRTGYLVPVRDTKLLADKICALVNDREQRMEFGERGYARVREMCDLEDHGKRIENIYLSILG